MYLPLSWPLLVMLGAISAGAGAAPHNLAIRGADVSTLAELEHLGVHYQDETRQGDLLTLMRERGLNLVRLRLWVDPRSAKGEPFGGGNNDLEKVIALAQRSRALNLPWLLDLHYSDFWADPGKQYTPRAWRGKSEAELAAMLHDYSAAVMQRLREAGVPPQMVQVGNELNNGMLWPLGQLHRQEEEEGFDRLAQLLKAAIAGIRAGSEGGITPRLMLHLAEGGDEAQCLRWFKAMQARDVPFDLVGLSFYPYWHGSLGDLSRTMNSLATQIRLPLLVVETAYGHDTVNQDAVRNAFGEQEAVRGGFAATPEGQLAFLDALRAAIAAVPDRLGLGFVYWEPGWIRVTGDSWASQAGMAFLGIDEPLGNGWENQALFDREGRGLPALAAFAPTR
ncbi:galactosidase [Aeromonas hydrophila]|uniref:glycoside hydrolase family 53 protein n=1 Tax=Aeromonas TaxID=642 RepID=UPI001A1AF933|nr:glycosyl hydrolase 53 family protein [Aeromonas hydrophila]EHA1064989.1 galactosidase [Aeromonas hydrophila]MCX4117177.1 glycosyl hydrolase 53 family protein [Aeromonas hydrophila]MDD9229661.1 glycosyl hydrolase 53 family protein [Aeromonas hydrophila]HAT1549460.1 galactosidase [Aeromonas hydrophila]